MTCQRRADMFIDPDGDPRDADLLRERVDGGVGQ